MKPDAYRRNLRGPRLRCRSLPAAVWHPYRRRPGHQYPHSRKADPPAEGIGFQEVREIADELAVACALQPIVFGSSAVKRTDRPNTRAPCRPGRVRQPGPRHAQQWADQNLPPLQGLSREVGRSCCSPRITLADICATLFIPGHRSKLSRVVPARQQLGSEVAADRTTGSRDSAPASAAMNCRGISAARHMSSISSWTSAHTAICIVIAAASNSASTTRTASATKLPL